MSNTKARIALIIIYIVKIWSTGRTVKPVQQTVV